MSAPTNPNDRDYLDKGLDSAQKKYGGQRFSDPNKNRAMNEKITDFIRRQFEKITGFCQERVMLTEELRGNRSGLERVIREIGQVAGTEVNLGAYLTDAGNGIHFA
ncbi:MAG: hypothetical protein Q9217_003242 [Psora testacea]